MECRHTASNTHKISLGNPKRVSFFSACFSYAYFFYQVILSPGNRKRSPCATIKKERGLAAPVSWKSPKVLANGRTLSESELLWELSTRFKGGSVDSSIPHSVRQASFSESSNDLTLADAVVATNRFRELDARFKSHDGMDLDPSTPEIESGYEFNRRSIEDDRAADDRNSISDQDIDSRL